MYLQADIKILVENMEKFYDNPVSMLAKKTGLSRPTVSKFFNFQAIKPSSTEIIYELCLDLIEQKQEKMQRVTARKDLLFQGLDVKDS